MPYAPEVTEQPTASEIRQHLQGAGEYLLGLRRTAPDQRGDTHEADVRSAVDFIHEFDTILTAVERSAAPEPRGPQAAFEPGQPELRTPGEQLTAADVYEEGRGRYGATFVEHTVRGSLASRDVRTLLAGGSTSVTVGDDGGMWRPLGTPIPPLERRQRLFIRDVLNVIPTGLSAIPYIRELNPTVNEGGATAVAEGTPKPEVTMEFEQVIAPVVTIAAWVPVTTQIIEDAPTLQGYVNTRLAYMIALREEAQIVSGPGTGANMQGITETAGTQTQSEVTGDFPATIGQAIGKIENVDGDATFVVANPLNYWVAATKRFANQFDNAGHPLVGPPASAQPNISFGLQEIRSRVMASGSALVGAAMGATIADRMQTTIRIGNQHSDFFTTNKVAVLAEERVALLVHRPDLFVEATVPTS